MIPINPAVKNTTITDEAADRSPGHIALPEDLLRAGAAVSLTTRRRERARCCARLQLRGVHAPGRRWLHLVLQQGDGATPRSAGEAAGEKKSDKEIQEAVAAATAAGTIKPTPFGTMSYRLYGKKDSHPSCCG